MNKIDCKICGKLFKAISNSHLKFHSMTTKQYVEKFGKDSLTTEEYRLARSESSKGKNNPNYNKSWSDDQKQAASKKCMGRKAWNKGVPCSDSQKKKQIETMKEMYASGRLSPSLLGKQLPEETKQKISESVRLYAQNNTSLLSDRGKKAAKTFRSRIGEDAYNQRMKNISALVPEETRKENIKFLISYNKKKITKSKATLVNKLEYHGYSDIQLHGRKVSYICPNGSLHNNDKQYFDDYKINLRGSDLSTCFMCMPKNTSRAENEVLDFITKLIGKDAVVKSERSLISPYEIDIYIPSMNVAIEYNGLYWHSEELGKDKLYHSNKKKLCNEKGVDLIQIFEDEWIYKPDIVKSILTSKLGKCENIIYARKCTVSEITQQQAKAFVDNNHLYGYHKCFTKLGLFYEGVLVQVMTFSKNNASRKQKGIEIDRLCTKINTSVVGGASKLFKHYLKSHHNGADIVSYSDLRYGEGEVYKQLGFFLKGTTPPSYYYFKTQERIRYHRFTMRKKKSEYESNKTERQLRAEQGYYTIYDCGHNKWVYKSK